MNEVVSDRRLRLLKGTLVAALISGGGLAISAAALQVDALRYLLVAVGAALIASPFLGVPKRMVAYTAARRGSSYAGFFILFLPIAFILTTLILGAFLWLGLSAGILELEDYVIPVIGVVSSVLINFGILVYNLLNIRGSA